MSSYDYFKRGGITMRIVWYRRTRQGIACNILLSLPCFGKMQTAKYRTQLDSERCLGHRRSTPMSHDWRDEWPTDLTDGFRRSFILLSLKEFRWGIQGFNQNWSASLGFLSNPCCDWILDTLRDYQWNDLWVGKQRAEGSMWEFAHKAFPCIEQHFRNSPSQQLSVHSFRL